MADAGDTNRIATLKVRLLSRGRAAISDSWWEIGQGVAIANPFPAIQRLFSRETGVELAIGHQETGISVHFNSIKMDIFRNVSPISCPFAAIAFKHCIFCILPNEIPAPQWSNKCLAKPFQPQLVQ